MKGVCICLLIFAGLVFGQVPDKFESDIEKKIQEDTQPGFTAKDPFNLQTENENDEETATDDSEIGSEESDDQLDDDDDDITAGEEEEEEGEETIAEEEDKDSDDTDAQSSRYKVVCSWTFKRVRRRFRTCIVRRIKVPGVFVNKRVPRYRYVRCGGFTMKPVWFRPCNGAKLGQPRFAVRRVPGLCVRRNGYRVVRRAKYCPIKTKRYRSAYRFVKVWKYVCFSVAKTTGPRSQRG